MTPHDEHMSLKTFPSEKMKQKGNDSEVISHMYLKVAFERIPVASN